MNAKIHIDGWRMLTIEWTRGLRHRSIHLSCQRPFVKLCRGHCICDVVAILDSIHD